ncbi:MAG: hypothetical protein LBE12_00940 [Planctomycetaceae bacterium]|jgi:hypothetical protein|nr:hypothetical protein [Planctomycetaceae bacterium]
MRLNQALAFLTFGVIFGFFAQTTMAYYNPEIGRFISRDPIGYETEDANLYRYVGNAVPNFSDNEGTCPNKINECNFPKNSSCGSDEEYNQFLTWYNNEMKRGHKWMKDIPVCPCTVTKKTLTFPAIFGNRTRIKYYDSGGKRIPNATWEEPGKPTGNYHKGADFCMRSKSFGGHASQCCYDKKGKLITEGTGSGSVDYVATGVFTYTTPWGTSHRSSDVLPADWANSLDCGSFETFSELYLCARPPKNGDCPSNAVDSEGNNVTSSRGSTNGCGK